MKREKQGINLFSAINRHRTPLRSLFICCLLFACATSTATNPKERKAQLTLLSSRQVDISEPSGLAIDPSGTLWAVGNNPEFVYRLRDEGRVVDTLAYVGDDLEGIVFDPSDSTLWIVEEKRREVVHLNLDGNVLQRRKIELDGKSNNGLEGICIDSVGDLYILNEQKPGLFIELNTNFSIKEEHRLDFAADYSGLAYDPLRESFWVLSHQNSELFLWNGSEGVLSSHSIPATKAEGVTINSASTRLYIIDETDQMLYIYALSIAPN